ncbi:hypothetical protein A3752_17065, partial [Oleiphilus sp. HI0081]
QIILLPVVTLLLLIGVSLWLSHSLKQEAQELEVIKSKNEEMAKRLETLSVKAKRMRKDESLVAANQRLHAKAEARQRMIEMLDTVVVKDDEGFSNILLSLARQNLDKLWLNSIIIGSSGKEMHIEGITLNGDLVPEYLQKLRQEDSLLGRTFTLFELEKHEGKRHWLNFSLRSEEHTAAPEVLLSRLDSSEAILNYAKDSAGSSVEQEGGQK